MHLIIDGYNLIRQSDVLRSHERQGLEAGRKALIRMLAGYRRVMGHRITVVFDGWLGGPPQEERDREAGIEHFDNHGDVRQLFDNLLPGFFHVPRVPVDGRHSVSPSC